MHSMPTLFTTFHLGSKSHLFSCLTQMAVFKTLFHIVFLWHWSVAIGWPIWQPTGANTTATKLVNYNMKRFWRRMDVSTETNGEVVVVLKKAGKWECSLKEGMLIRNVGIHSYLLLCKEWCFIFYLLNQTNSTEITDLFCNWGLTKEQRQKLHCEHITCILSFSCKLLLNSTQFKMADAANWTNMN